MEALQQAAIQHEATPPAILVVDDEPSIRILFHQMLTAAGYRVVVAADGRMACEILAGSAGLAVVITDLIMPNQEGIETIRAIRQQFPAIKIIAVSGAFGGKFLRMARLLGADATLTKPVDAQELCGAVAQVLGSS